LLDKGATVDAKTDTGETALLFTAVNNGPLDLIKRFLDKHADPNVSNSTGTTPLIALAAKSSLELEHMPLGDGFAAGIELKANPDNLRAFEC